MRIDTLSVLSVLAVGLLASSAQAKPSKPNPPTLHGFCSSTNPCTDNGTDTPTSVNPPVFGFAASGKAATGDVTIDILVPDNDTVPSSYTISGVSPTGILGTSTFTAKAVSTSTPWASGKLDAYLGISASPANPIGAYLPTTLKYDKGATGFYVFQADLGTVTLPSNSSPPDSDLMTTNTDLFVGSYVVAFINQSGAYGATANSGAILEKGNSIATPEPATWAMMLSGFGLVGAMLRRRARPVAA